MPISSPARSTHGRPGLAACAGALLVTLAGSATAAAPSPLAAEFDGLLAQEELTGVVWAVMDGDRVDLGARGTADAARGLPLRPDARLHVGSIAKTVVALAILRRVSAHALDLDAPVQMLLPDLPIDNPWAATHPLRLRHLLDMTGGFDDVRLWQVFSARTEPDLPLQDALRRDPGVLRLRTPPGTRFSYSNVGFTLAARVLEVDVGERYETWIAREVFRPLGMEDSTMLHAAPARDAEGGDPRLAWGHAEGRVPVITPPIAIRPAAQLTTTAADMMRLASFLAGDGRIGGEPFIDTDLVAALGRPHGTDAANAGLHSGYGLGLYTRDRHGAIGLCHGGSTAGFRALLCVYRDPRRAFFVAHNTDREGAAYERFDARLVRALALASRPEPTAPGPVPAADRAWSGRYVPAPSRHSQGELADRLFGAWTLQLGGAGGKIAPPSGADRALVRTGTRLYRQDDRQQASLVLLADADGRHSIATGTLTLRRIGWAEQAALWMLAAGGGAGLAWWLVAPPVRRLRHRTALARTPAWWAVLAVLLAGAGVAVQPWQGLGDPTAASVALAAATLLLPILMAWQGVLAWRRRGEAPATWGRRLDLAAVALSIAACGLLAAFGLWPVALWRL